MLKHIIQGYRGYDKRIIQTDSNRLNLQFLVFLLASFAAVATHVFLNG